MTISASPGTGRVELLGRATERAVLDEVLDRARAGRSGGIVLTGEPGVGKTALCAYAIASACGFQVVAARGAESERNLAFAGLSTILRPLLDHRDAVHPAQSAALDAVLAPGSGSAGDRFPIYAATLSLLAAAASKEPLLVVVDDAHWLDAASQEALVFTARRLLADPVALLFAMREGVAVDPSAVPLPAMRVARLPDQEARALVDRLTANRATASVSERLVDAGGGNPLALDQLVRSLTAEQLQGTEPLDEPLRVGIDLEDGFARGIDSLPLEARKALVVAAASGLPDVGVIGAAVSELGLRAHALDPAEAAGLITADQGTVEFRHPLVRSAAYHRAAPGDRRAAHAALAKVLVADEQRHAWHLAGAAAGPDEAAAVALDRAARSARRQGGHVAAATMLERAVRLTTDPAMRAKRLVRAARSAQVGGRVKWAGRLAEEAASVATDPSQLGEALFLRGTAEGFGGLPRPGRDLLVAGAERVSDSDPRQALLMLLDAVLLSVVAGDVRAAVSLAARSCDVAKAVGGTHAQLADGIRCSVRFLHGESDGASTLGVRLMDLIRAPDFPPSAYWSVELAAADLIYMGDYEAAESLLNDVVAGLRATSSIGVLPFALGTRTQLNSRAGRWVAAYADATEAVALADMAGQHTADAWTLGLLARVEAAWGRAEDCRTHAASAIALGTERGIGSALTQGLAALGLLELGRGEPEAALEPLEEVRRLIDEYEVHHPAALPWMPDLIEAYVRTGRREQAASEIHRLEAAAERTNSAWARVTALRCRGMTCPESEIDGVFREALAEHARIASPFDEARTLLCYGERLRRARNPAAARARLQTAYDAFQRLGAVPWAERARRELGVGTAPPRRGAFEAANELTPQEVQVAIVIAEGATNKEAAARLFVSPRTVGAHLESIFRKLGIHRRSELARLVHEGSLQRSAGS